MLDLTILQNFLAALALGALIGLEREYAQYKGRGHSYAGIRTFPLIAVFGTLSAFLGELISPWILILGIILMGVLVVVAYFVVANNDKTRKHIGITSELAGLLTFFIGVLCYQKEITLAIILTIFIAIILYTRSKLHHFAEKIKKEELSDTLKFALIAFVILPLLPNQSYGPYGGLFNPYLIWLMVVFVSGIGFVGYILMKWLGERGITLAGLLGGLVSSTAVTTSFAVRSKKEQNLYRALILGVILANAVMLIRILIEVSVLNRKLLPTLLIPFVALAVVTLIFAYYLWRKSKNVKAKSNIELTSPFTLIPALKFGALFAVIIIVSKVVSFYFADKGIYLVSFLSGLADVDAITISLTQLAKDGLWLETARNGIVIAALTNIAVKGGIAFWLGGKKFGRIILTFNIIIILLGLALIWMF